MVFDDSDFMKIDNSIILLALVVLMLGCAQQALTAEHPKTDVIPNTEISEKNNDAKIEASQPKANPDLKIVSPKDNKLIKNLTVTVQLQADNFNIVPVGQPVKEGEGHFHVWLDSDKRVTTNNIISFENVVSGQHSITAELVNSDHSSLNPRIIKTITIDVESDYVPKIEQSQAGLKEFTVEADDKNFYPNALMAKIGDKVKINFKFRDASIYFAGLDVKGPFPTIQYKLNGQQPLTAEFTMQQETKITSYWPSTGIKKTDLIVEVEK